MRDDKLAGSSRRQLAYLHLIEKLHPKGFLYRRDTAGNRRLIHTQGARSTGQRTISPYGEDVPQVIPVDFHAGEIALLHRRPLKFTAGLANAQIPTANLPDTVSDATMYRNKPRGRLIA
jgi:hypothetical protein